VQKKQLVLVLVALGAFGIAAYLVFGRSASTVQIGKNFTEAGVCLSCKAEGQVSYPREEPAPHRCPKCGEQAFYPYYFCNDCKYRFVPPLVAGPAGTPPGLPLGAVCPRCQSSSVGPWFADQPGYEPEGTMPLPKWPQ
jgi:Zn ribbon nucleic-acid-binding protein